MFPPSVPSEGGTSLPNLRTNHTHSIPNSRPDEPGGVWCAAACPVVSLAVERLCAVLCDKYHRVGGVEGG